MIVESDELYNLTGVAKLFDVNPSYISNWRIRARDPLFPEPLVVICGISFWHIDDLTEWADKKGKEIVCLEK